MPRCPERGVLALAFAVAVTVLVSACGGSGTSTDRSSEGPERSPDPTGQLPAETVAPAHCPSEYAGCRSAQGRIIYVERHDPDGDGDAHFVILDPQGITFRGITSIDVEASLRPKPLPGVGDLISAAGPVQTGSFGQEQIHALVLHVGRGA